MSVEIKKIKDHLNGYNPIPNYQSVRELKFPRIPESVLGDIEKNPQLYVPNWDWSNIPDAHLYANQNDVVRFSYTFTENISKWCNANICDNVKWEWQIIQQDLPRHKDFDVDGLADSIVHTKFLYLATLGGENVETDFYDNFDDAEPSEHYVLKPHTWYLFNAIKIHSVTGIETKQSRFTIIGNSF